MMNRKEMNAAKTELIRCRANTTTAADTVAALVAEIGFESAREIIAAMVNAKGSWDARIDDRRRAWAADFAPSQEELNAAYIYYCDDIHPAHMDQIAAAMMKYQPAQEPAQETTQPAQEEKPAQAAKKGPKARTNSAAAISKISSSFTNAIKESDPAAVRLHISGGNAKLGAIMNISLPPVVTCHNCGSCSKYCYAVRSYNRFTGTAAGWNENYILFLSDPDRYFSEISAAVKLQRFFRWHVSGDIVNGAYLAGMIRVAQENPKCEFLAFTKAYQTVNAAIAAGAVIPGNLHILFSAAPGNDMPNPYRIPDCHVNFADPSQNTYTGGAEYEYHCSGNCTECAANGCGCFFLKPGDVTIINQH